METALHNHNIQHFQHPKQCRTPFATPPLLRHLGFGSTSAEVSDFAQNPNHKLPEYIHPLAKEILEELRPQHNEPSSTDFTVTAGDLQSAFSKWKEKTTTSWRGTHLGHYKVWLKNYQTELTEGEEKGNYPAPYGRGVL